MIREFFAPRLALFFLLFAALVWAGLYVWMMASNKQHRRWLTHARIPFIALAISVVLTAGLAFVIQFLN
jgi:uncharacterized membrane protein